MSERRMSAGVKESSKGGFQDSPSTSHEVRTSRIVTKKRTKHIDNILNAKLIMSILPAYLPPLSGTINQESMPRDFDYALVMAYLSKGC
jgi:hypothetical protein